MKIYLVGGAVRDQLLDLPVRDRDWVVVGATVEEMKALGYRQRDADFPVFLHPQSGEEYALARRETKIAPGYQGFAVDVGPDVTLEEDLQRRDLTINAIAQDINGGVIDPFNGRTDVEQGLLRHVSPAFIEDPVRVLRVARFAARLGRWGFRVSHGTQALMRKMVLSGELQALSGERLWSETKRALAEDQPWRFLWVLKRCGALALLMPALDRVLPETASHAPEDEGERIAALRRAVALTSEPRIRFTVLFYPYNGAVAESLLPAGLQVEKRYAELLSLATRWLPHYPAMDKADPVALYELLEGCRAHQDASQLRALIAVADSLFPDKRGTGAVLMEALEKILSITARQLAATGLSGKALGTALQERRIQAIAKLLEGGDMAQECT